MTVATMPTGWQAWGDDEKKYLLAQLQTEQVRRLSEGWQPYPWQLCPRPLQAQEMWLLMGGRGTGKTDGSAHYVLDHIDGPPCDERIKGGHRIAIVAPTLGDAAESCVRGPSGLQAYDPRVRLFGTRGGTYVRFPGGAEGKLFGAHTPNDVERLRAGGNRCLVWLEEAAAQRHLADVLHHARLGLRIGPRAHFIASTTPKARPEVRKLVESKRTVLTQGRTRDAHHLAQATLDVFLEDYEGTRLGRQELDGELLLDVEGALWSEWSISRNRHLSGPATVPQLAKVVVAVDPNAGGPDECGIVVVGRTADQLPDANGRMQNHGYVLADYSGHFPNPGAWGAAVARAYHKHQADSVVAEVNNGGDMVGHVIHVEDASVRYRSVNATRGKAIRAEPVVALYEQDRMHHVGTLARLEDQMTTWTDAPGDPSPDRMDALVWGAWDLLVRPRGGRASAA